MLLPDGCFVELTKDLADQPFLSIKKKGVSYKDAEEIVNQIEKEHPGWSVFQYCGDGLEIQIRTREGEELYGKY